MTEKEFGFLSNVIKTGTKYVPEAISPEEFGLKDDASKEVKLAFQLEVEKLRLKEMSALKTNMPKFYASIYETLSPSSVEVVKAHKNFEDADLKRDGNTLWTIIVETHCSNISGSAMTEFDKARMESDFALLCQGDKESISGFKSRFDEMLDLLKHAKCTARTEDQLSVQFLTKLDKRRYGSMLTALNNQHLLGADIPNTLDKAYRVANKWKVEQVVDAQGENLESVLISADEVTSPGASKRQIKGKKPTPQAPPTPKAQPAPKAPTGEATKWCYKCHEKGHIRPNCPLLKKNQETALIAQGETEECDEECEEYFNGAAINGIEMCMFTPTEVLLDNQASRCMFHNENLLKEVENMSGFKLGGVNKTAKPLEVTKGGRFRGLPVTVGVHRDGAANILSKTQLLDAGERVSYDQINDVYVLNEDMIFSRKQLEDGRKSAHYSMETDTVMLQTVAENARRYTKREVRTADAAREFIARLGYPSDAAAGDILSGSMINVPVTKADVANATSIYGPSVACLKGKTVKSTPTPMSSVLSQRVTQVQQILQVDIIFLKGLSFLIGVLIPLGYVLIEHIKDRTGRTLEFVLSKFVKRAANRGFDVVTVQSDEEGGVFAVRDEIKGVTIDNSGPGQHAQVVERMARTVKERVRCHANSLPYTMTKLILICCVLFCCSRINLQPSSTCTDLTSPMEQWTGRKPDYGLDARFSFGEYVQATVRETDNTLATRTEGCIAVLARGNSRGSVGMLSLRTNKIVTRDQFRKLPIPDVVIRHITSMASKEGMRAGGFEVFADPETTQNSNEFPQPTMMPIDRVGPIPERFVNQSNIDSLLEDAGVGENDSGENGEIGHTHDEVDVEADSVDTPDVEVELGSEIDVGSTNNIEVEVTSSTPEHEATTTEVTPRPRRSRRFREVKSILETGTVGDRVLLNLNTAQTMAEKNNSMPQESIMDYCFTMSVRQAMKERPEDAEPVIVAELQQIHDKKVFTPVKVETLSHKEMQSIISSSMFLKDKYSASGLFEKFKARLVAGGHLQKRDLYENLSSPTASTTSVMIVAGIAAKEGRVVITIDIGGAFLNVSMQPTGVMVHMRLNKLMSMLLVKIDPAYGEYLRSDGTMVVRLDKALYGCVEASSLWFKDLSGVLLAGGFTQNPYDMCVFNRIESDKSQTTIVLHVDDMMVTGSCEKHVDSVNEYLKSKYPETSVKRGKVIDYIGMTFDFSKKGEVKVTMENCVNDIVNGSGVETSRATPAAECLFEVRDGVELASTTEAEWFHSHVAKLLYVSKRVKPECLVSVSFLTTRVNTCDQDDLSKLRRVLGYVRRTKDRGIVIRIGEKVMVRAYIDAAYGVHAKSGKSHTGATIIVGEGGPVYSKSTKQKIVTKSSTESELVGMSDVTSNVIHVRNFVLSQGYQVEPAIIYQDNMSTMALVKKGGPASERSRHINIRYFWMCEKVADGDIWVKHCGTKDMFANILTKPIQGSQFIHERAGLTNWE